MACAASAGVRPSDSSASRTSASGPIEIDVGAFAAQLVAKVEHDPLCHLLAYAGHDREGVGIPRDDRASKRVGLQRREEARATLGPTPLTPVSRSKSSRSSVEREPVQRHGVVAHHHARVQPSALAHGRQRRQHRRRHGSS